MNFQKLTRLLPGADLIQVISKTKAGKDHGTLSQAEGFVICVLTDSVEPEVSEENRWETLIILTFA